MEDVVHSRQLKRWFQAISYLPNSLNDGVQPDISGVKLARYVKSLDALGCRHSEEKLVSHFKLQRFAPLVRIALMSTLGRSHSFLDCSDLLVHCPD